MMLLLAQSQPWEAPATIGAWLGCLLFAAMLFNALGKVWDRVNGKAKTMGPQPFAVEMTKALHEQFAAKNDFEALKAHTTKRHGELFGKIEAGDAKVSNDVDRRFKELQVERTRTMEKLDNRLQFISESLVELKTEVKIRNQKS
jgi:hypothetical protein